jgi:ATP-dependent DNA ligase
LALRGGSETRVLSRNEKDFGQQVPEIQNSIAALDVQDAIIDYEGAPPGLLAMLETGSPA